jgi:hypothetical protein
MARFWWAALCVTVSAILVANAEPIKTIPPGNDSTYDDLVDPTPEEYAHIQTWMDISCCWSNNCCKKVPASALEPVPTEPGEKFSDHWTVKATGQVRKRTGWSQDGQTWRCTCDHINGQWVSHPKANTRCIFPVASGS